jgi:hypothetical protein
VVFVRDGLSGEAMSMQRVSVMVPPLHPVPRGAIWVADAVSRLVAGVAGLRSGLAVWLEAVRAKVAADRAARRDASGRARLVALACRYQATQPEFAKDLFAAANNDRGG